MPHRVIIEEPPNHFMESGTHHRHHDWDLEDMNPDKAVTTDLRSSMSRFEDFLSPAEAEFAFEDEVDTHIDKDNKRPKIAQKISLTKPETPLVLVDHRKDAQGPISLPKIIEMSKRSASPQSALHIPFQGKQLSVLDEEPALLVPIFITLKTNVIVKDEYTLVTELSELIAKLYFCSQDAIVLNVEHSACLMFAASFAPAYIINLATTSSQLELESNRLNTAEMQSLLLKVLKVPSHRGIVRYQSILDEDVGYKGTTIAHHNHRASRELHATRPPSLPHDEPQQPEEILISNPMVPVESDTDGFLNAHLSIFSEGDDVEQHETHNGDDRSAVIRSRRTSWLDTSVEPVAIRANNDLRRSRNFEGETLHPRPRPMSAYSLRLPQERDRLGRGANESSPALPSTTPVSRATSVHSLHQAFGAGAGDYLSRPDSYDWEEGGMPPPPPIPQGKKAESTKVSRRKSIFARFMR